MIKLSGPPRIYPRLSIRINKSIIKILLKKKKSIDFISHSYNIRYKYPESISVISESLQNSYNLRNFISKKQKVFVYKTSSILKYFVKKKKHNNR